MLKKYIGDKKFYSMILAVAVPIVIQNGITNFVNLLDNIMVGLIGTEPMSGVSIINQLVFVYNLCIFGAFSGAGIFTAQYYGQKNNYGIRQTCRFKLDSGIMITGLAFVVFYLFGDKLVSLYLNEGSEGNLEQTLNYAMTYLKFVIWGLPFFMIVQVYSSTLRECGQTLVPMIAGVVSLLINLTLNWLLIFGKLGFPALGVTGAAIATVMSRIAEASIVAIWTHKHSLSYPFAKSLLSSLHVDKAVAKKILVVGSPLLINEAFWSSGQAVLIQCYSMRGLTSIAGFNIATTFINVFKTVLLSMGASVGIIVGRVLGTGNMEEAVDTDRKMIAFSIFLSCIVAVIMAGLSPVFPKIYNTTDAARVIATQAVLINAIFMPLDAFKNGTYYTLRSGGRTWLTFIFDAFFVWAVSIPIAFFLSRFTALSSANIYFCVYMGEWIKAILGYILVKKGVWLRNIVV